MSANKIIQAITTSAVCTAACTAVAFQYDFHKRIKNLESRKFESTTHNASAAHGLKVFYSSEASEVPPLTAKARRELREELATGRSAMLFGYRDGIKRICEDRCEDLEKPCDIYEELKKLHEKCKREEAAES